MASFTASVKTIYSASVDEKAIIGCLFEHKLIGPPLSMKMKPKVDFRIFLSSAQSKLEYLFTNSLLWPP